MAAAKKKKEEIVKVEGVILQAVDETVLKFYCRQEGLDDNQPVENLIKTFVAWVASNVEAQDLAECARCLGDSPASYDRCPFCGDASVVEEGGEEEAEEAEEEAEEAEEEADEDDEEADEEREDSMNARKLAVVKPQKKNEEFPLTTTVVSEEETQIMPAPKGTEQDLDDAIVKVQEMKGQISWELGQAIAPIYKGFLWRARTDADGKPKYTSFASFCTAELQLSVQHVLKLVDISQRFDKKQVAKIGVAKLGFILRLPPGEEKELKALEYAENSSLSELRQLIKNDLIAFRETGRKRIETPARQGKSKPAEPVVPDGAVSVALAMGRSKIPLFAGRTKTRATKLEEKATGTEVLINGVKRTYRIEADKDGQLFLVVTTSRETEE